MTLPISGDFLPSDPLSRKRTSAAGGRDSDRGRSSTAGRASDRAAILSSSPETVRGYVQSVKAMNPVDLHRVEQLRERIRSGDYRADPDEMAASLADILARQRPGNRGA